MDWLALDNARMQGRNQGYAEAKADMMKWCLDLESRLLNESIDNTANRYVLDQVLAELKTLDQDNFWLVNANRLHIRRAKLDEIGNGILKNKQEYVSPNAFHYALNEDNRLHYWLKPDSEPIGFARTPGGPIEPVFRPGIDVIDKAKVVAEIKAEAEEAVRVAAEKAKAKAEAVAAYEKKGFFGKLFSKNPNSTSDSESG